MTADPTAALIELAAWCETEHGDWHYGRVARDAAATLAAEKERADALEAAHEPHFLIAQKADQRARAAEARVVALREALEEIESFPISGYHAAQAQRIARDALARDDEAAE